jgi:hypothetical protein
MRLLIMAAVLTAVPLATAGVGPMVEGTPQERGDADRDRDERKTERRTLAELTAALKRNVNGKASVRMNCDSGGHQMEVEETTQVLEASQCKLTLRTRKDSNSADSHRETDFTLYVDLADLTFPSTVQQQSFSGCKPAAGTVVKLMSRTQPGKSVRSTRRATSAKESGAAQMNSRRNDLSLFFADEVLARKAGRILDHAIKKCGGREWPDEDDLP